MKLRQHQQNPHQSSLWFPTEQHVRSELPLSSRAVHLWICVCVALVSVSCPCTDRISMIREISTRLLSVSRSLSARLVPSPAAAESLWKNLSLSLTSCSMKMTVVWLLLLETFLTFTFSARKTRKYMLIMIFDSLKSPDNICHTEELVSGQWPNLLIRSVSVIFVLPTLWSAFR